MQLKILYGAALALLAAACSPSEKRVDLPSPLSASQFKFSVSQEQGYDNHVYLMSETPDVIPYWNYGVGTSTKVADTVDIPFLGTHTIYYSAETAGGFVKGDSVQIQVSQNDTAYFSDPHWAALANGAAGKTWVMDMTQPVGWYGLDYLKHNGSADDWSYHPTYVGNEWVLPNQDWGQMTFDLDGDYHYTVAQKDANGNVSTCKCGFVYDINGGTIKLSGCALLYGGDYYSQVSNWGAVTVIDFSATSITLGVIRDNPSAGGLCWIGFTYIPEQ